MLQCANAQNKNAKCAKILNFNLSNAQIHKCPNAQMPKCTNAQLQYYSCSNKCANGSAVIFQMNAPMLNWANAQTPNSQMHKNTKRCQMRKRRNIGWVWLVKLKSSSTLSFCVNSKS